MAKNKSDFPMPESKAMKEIKQNITNRKNNKANSDVVYNAIENKEEEKLLTWIEKTGVAAYHNIEKLTKKTEELRKPDVQGDCVHNGGMDFTNEPDKFSKARVKELSDTHKLLGNLIDAYDAAMEKGTEDHWKKVESLNKNVN